MKKIFTFVKSVWGSVYKAIKSNPDVQSQAANHPKLFGFLKKRLHWRDFLGLPLTFIIIIFIYIFFLFIGIIADILSSDPIVFVDVNLTSLLYTFRNPLLTLIFLKITLLGNWQLILAGIIIFSAILWLWQKKVYIFSLWLVMAGSALFSYLGKLIIHRPRPQNVAVFDLSSFSFPSGHATLALAFYGFIAYFLFKQIKSWKYKILILAADLVLILLIGFSRMYLGFHFLSDIIGGYLLGILWLLIGISLIEWLLLAIKPVDKDKIKAGKKFRILTPILIFTFIALYSGYGILYNPPFQLSKEKKVAVLKTNDVLDLFSGSLSLSKYSETPTSKQQEPISFIIMAKNDGDLINVFKAAGWSLADSPNLGAIFKLGEAAILNKEYVNAPVTPVFWGGYVNNFGFEKPTESQTVRSRHHARFWQTNQQLLDGQNIYVGTASLDEGLKWLLTHTINPDLDKEREYIFNDLTATGAIVNWQKVQFVEPQLNKNFAGDYFFTDGDAYIINLK
ncbi:MAG: LssY C-terminal domain-containing protein [Candidatus Parcubacteria bacterium]|nr:LssY C-terminal domain-containing protein [Candidatus Parcubacteria bacterium]